MKVSNFVSLVTLCFITSTAPMANAQSVRVSGTLTGGAGYQILLLAKDGTSKTATIASNGKFSLSTKKSKLKGSSLHLTKDGQYWGPVTLAQKLSTQRAARSFSGKLPSGKKVLALGRLSLQESSHFAKLNRALKATYRQSLSIRTDSDGRPLGAGELGLVSTADSQVLGVRATAGSDGDDTDNDGIPSILDADDDGDLVLDSTDPDSAGSDVPYTSLFLDFRRTINSNVRSGLNDTVIDNIVSGENAFAFAIFLSQSPNSQVTGGHVICDDALTYCRRNTPLGYFGGVSESSEEFKNRPWSELLTSAGYPRLENLTFSGGRAIAAAVQPRVGRDVFRPGDIIRAVLTGSSGNELSSRTFTVAPYFVSVPALLNYDAGAGTVTVDYSSVTEDSGSIPGTSSGDPIVLDSDGLLTVTFWRPQRSAVRSDETGYVDIGRLKYGIYVDSLQATCAGLYSAISSDLTEDSGALGTGGSPLTQNGADLRPLRDSQIDRAANVSNTLSFTVDLKTCLSRAGGSPGTYTLSLSAAGEDVTGGTPAASQSVTVTIP